MSVKSMRALGSYALVYLLEGSGFYQDANRYSQRVRSGDLLVLFPELAHAYGPGAKEYWNEFYLVFDGPVFDLWRKAGLLNASRPVHHCEPVDHWLGKLKGLAEASRPATDAERFVEISCFLGVLTELLTSDPTKKSTTGEAPWISAAQSLLQANLDSALELGDVARQVGMSYESFRKKFVQKAGVSPSRYRAEKRIKAACDLLRYTQMTNGQIAESLGFQDPFHFSKRFKQITNMSPRIYRQSSVRRGK